MARQGASPEGRQEIEESVGCVASSKEHARLSNSRGCIKQRKPLRIILIGGSAFFCLLQLHWKSILASFSYPALQTKRFCAGSAWDCKEFLLTYPCEGRQLTPLPWPRVCSRTYALLLPAPACKESQLHIHLGLCMPPAQEGTVMYE